MKSQEIEVILSRHFAESLHIPIFITDPLGNLLFYNEGAEELLGKRFEDTGPMPVEEWSTLFRPTDVNGVPIPPPDLPLVKTLTTKKPAQGEVYINSLNGEKHHINVTSFPLIGNTDNYVAAIAIFWKIEES